MNPFFEISLYYKMSHLKEFRSGKYTIYNTSDNFKTNWIGIRIAEKRFVEDSHGSIETEEVDILPEQIDPMTQTYLLYDVENANIKANTGGSMGSDTMFWEFMCRSEFTRRWAEKHNKELEEKACILKKWNDDCLKQLDLEKVKIVDSEHYDHYMIGVNRWCEEALKPYPEKNNVAKVFNERFGLKIENND